MTTAVTTAHATELTQAEVARFTELKQVVHRHIAGFVEMGTALAEIHSRRLYRATHTSFEAFCQAEFGFTRQRAHQLIGASEVAAELSTCVDCQPPTERQTRAIASLPPEEQKPAWVEANEKAKNDGCAAPTGKHVNEAVRARKPQPEATPEPEHEPEPDVDVDLAAELAAAVAENEKLSAEIESLKKDDLAKELSDLRQQYAQLNARLQDEMRAHGESAEKAKWAMDILKKVMASLGVERPTKILSAIAALKGE